MVLRSIERRSNGQFQLRGSDKRIFKFEKKRPLEKKLVIKRSSRPSCVPGSSLRSSSSPPFGKKRTCWSEYSSSVVFIAGSSQHSSRAEPKNIASKKTFGLESQTKDFCLRLLSYLAMAEEIKMKELTKKRASIKSQLTQFTTFLNIIKSCEQLSEEQLVELEIRIDKMVTIYATYDHLQGQLEYLSAKPDEQFTERELFEANYYKQLASARALLTQHRTQLANKVSSNDLSVVARRSNVRLPKINLPHFSGGYKDWLEFKDIYVSLIHEDNTIDNINKFHYLRSSLSGTASLVIKSLDFRGDNYSTAWQLLCERFDNKQMLIDKHIQALFSVETLQKEGKTIEETNRLKQNTEHTHGKAKSFSVLTSKAKFNISCPLCRKDHYIFSCEQFKALPVAARLSKAKEFKLCLNCLRPGHLEAACPLGINSQVSTITQTCTLHLQSCDESYNVDVDCFVLPNITTHIPQTYIDLTDLQLPAGISLADPTFNIPSSIDILVGADIFWNVIGRNRIQLGGHMPTLFETKLGWLISACWNITTPGRPRAGAAGARGALDQLARAPAVSHEHCVIVHRTERALTS
ncbi:hypothetical protein SFRURICE_010685 [Spodoptera frugiperda]|nr:hypothetical protein SFRURICE_010685 [Spodoptera frugiperda]